jgi:hypothetical protein
MQRHELQSSLAEQINARWREAREFADNAQETAVQALNAIRDVGLLLPPDWRRLQGELDFGERSIQMCLSFARKHPEPVTDPTRAIRLLDDIRMATGLLPFSEGHGPQQLHSPNFFSVIAKQMVAFRSEWKKQLARSPLDQWEYSTLEQFVSQVEPMVEELNGIYDKARTTLDTKAKEPVVIAGPS